MVLLCQIIIFLFHDVQRKLFLKGPDGGVFVTTDNAIWCGHRKKVMLGRNFRAGMSKAGLTSSCRHIDRKSRRSLVRSFVERNSRSQGGTRAKVLTKERM